VLEHLDLLQVGKLLQAVSHCRLISHHVAVSLPPPCARRGGRRRYSLPD
jgi:hypothetical protein